MRGGEKCLEALCELYPKSPIYTLFYENGKVSETIARHPVFTSALQKFPSIYSHYRHYLPFFSRAIESFSIDGVDAVISTSHCVAKGIRKPAGAVHICYCFTPVRYVWGFFDEYFGNRDIFSKALIAFFLGKLKKWDERTNSRVDHFVAISQHIRKRIWDCYRREAEVIYPPVDTDFYAPDPAVSTEDFYLVVSALAPYKKIDLAVRAFNRLGKRLVIIGDGPERKALQKLARSNVEFLGWRSDETIRDAYRRSRALIFPGEEDFGIVPVESQACGGFVIAFEKGGALETVKAGCTGVFFKETGEDALIDAVHQFEKIKLNPQDSRAAAIGFGRERFKMEMQKMVARVVEEKKRGAGR